jgi:uncharacterized protein (TIGR02996 family)
MSAEAALLAAVWESPHDDTPRLVYADWLEENGDPDRAAFVRVQCELATLDEDDDRYEAVKAREQELWAAHGQAWAAALPRGVRLPEEPFHRGFPKPPARGGSVKAFIAAPAADLATVPLWELAVKAGPKQFAELMAAPNLRRVGALRLRDCPATPAAARQFAASPGLQNVSLLQIACERGRRPDGLVELLRSGTRLPHLRWVVLSGGGVTADVLAAVAESPLMAGVNRLALFNTAVAAAGIEALAAGPAAAGLTDLSLFHWAADDTTPDAIRSLFASRRLANLRDLSLYRTDLPGAAVDAILGVKAPAFRLRRFSLGFDLPDADVARLAGWAGWKDLRRLSLHGHRVGKRAAEALAGAKTLRKLKVLAIDELAPRDAAAAKEILRARFGDAADLPE